MTNPTEISKAIPTFHAVAGGHIHHHNCGHRNQTNWIAGHVGTSQQCHLTELDGMKDAEIVALHGSYCCSHCFVDAPTGNKMTEKMVQDLDGTTLRRAALVAESLRQRALKQTPALVALWAQLDAAELVAGADVEGSVEFEAGAKLFRAVMQMQKDLGVK